MRRSIKNIYGRLACLCLPLLMLGACTNDDFVEESARALQPGEISLQWVPANMGRVHVQTRGTDPKTALEQQINKVHVFLFNNRGEWLDPQGADAVQCYQYLEGRQNLVLQSDMFESVTDAADATVYVLANMPQDMFQDADGNGYPDGIGSMSDLEDVAFTLPAFSATLPEGGLPMVLKQENVDLSPDATTKIISLQLRSLMARIDLNFSMDPLQPADDEYSNRIPSLQVEEVRVGNFPTGGRISPQLDNTGTTVTTGDLISSPVVVQGSELTGQFIRPDQDVEATFYMFEHARQPKSLSDIFTNGQYPENITEEEKQRYKNQLAQDDAAYIELEGIYTNHNNHPYHVTYRLYPGADHTDDFTIRNNRQYINNISIQGITVNSEGPEALLDTRVDIDTQENPYFIEMLRERMHDAHFNVTPMDVFIYEPGGEVTVSILPDESGYYPEWIRMEPMAYSPTANGVKKATNAGDGKRQYFTDDLLSELAREEHSLSYTVTEGEERIYFYLDENVPTSNNGQEVPDREATVQIVYKAPNGDTETREVPIRQAGLLPVYFNKFADGGPYDQGREAYTFYIEYYEEYLEHYDGKDTYDETYEGLEWGFDGVRTNLDGSEWHTYLDYGWRNTMSIMRQFRNSLSYGEPEDIDLNTRPRGAAEYCYNKNKRNTQGQVEEVHWYLPTISELEYALETWYGIFDVFQSQWYWSSNPGCSYNDTGENSHYARATQVTYDPDDDEATSEGFVHIQSSANETYPQYWDSQKGEWKPGGHAPRTNVFRIRAAYIYQVPDGRNVPDLDNRGNYR